VIALACKGKKKEKAAPVAAVDPIEAAIKAQCHTWNEANSIKDATLLGELFADTLVNYYGIAKASRQYCVEDQGKWFADNPDSKQSFKEDSIRIERLPNDTLKAYFTKDIVIKGIPREIPSYISFLKVGDAYKIVAESQVGLEPKPKPVKAVKLVAKAPVKAAPKPAPKK
jgi:hypothetical protein